MKNKIIKISISLILFLIALLVPFKNILINHIIYFISYICVGFEVIQEALEHILKGKIFDENFLMTIATIGAFVIGEYPEAVCVMLLFQIGETLQDYAVDKSRKSITELMDIRPDFANVKRGNDIIKVNPNDVDLGEIIIVKPGEKIPLDGEIVEGKSLLNTSSLTGESVPREVMEGDIVLSGCINQNSLLKIKVTKKFEESTVSKILNLVENVSSKKSNQEKFITKFAKYYTPIVVFIAILLAFIPLCLHLDSNFYMWLYRALTFLVVSCPCALVISIPLGFFAGIGGASRNGILIKGSNYIEALSKTDTVVFDKTGTLTEGIFEVQKIETAKNNRQFSEDELLKIATYCENYSNHPISLSLKKAYGKTVDNDLVSDVQELSGLGICAKYADKVILIGNERLMQNNGIQIEKSEEIGTILYMAVDNQYVGHIIISDKIKQDSYKAIKCLRSINVNNIIMLTGDKKIVGEAVAKELSINEVHSELLPTDKAEKLEEILKSKSSNKNVAFVGDGINDSPVLALADVGIAMGGLGADSAIEAADIILMTDEPSKIVDAIKLSRKTIKIVKSNIMFALAIKIIVLLLSAFGISTMWMAIFADVGVSMLCILNSLRALKQQKC